MDKFKACEKSKPQNTNVIDPENYRISVKLRELNIVLAKQTTYAEFNPYQGCLFLRWHQYHHTLYGVIGIQSLSGL